jgi:hypothetical protein
VGSGLVRGWAGRFNYPMRYLDLKERWNCRVLGKRKGSITSNMKVDRFYVQ